MLNYCIMTTNHNSHTVSENEVNSVNGISSQLSQSNVSSMNTNTNVSANINTDTNTLSNTNQQSQAISLTFLYTDGNIKQILAQPGDNLLKLSRQHNLQIEGACGGVLACATCHVVISDPWFDTLPPATIREERMLDNAQEVELNSRLCCQIKITSNMHGMTIKIPASSVSSDNHDH